MGMAMFTIAQCRAKAAQKLERAESNPRHRRSLTTAAEAWLLLADRLEEIDSAMAGKDRGQGGRLPAVSQVALNSCGWPAGSSSSNTNCTSI